MLSTCNVCINIYILCVSSIIITVYVFYVCPSSSVGGVTVLFFSQLLYLGNISEPNQNFSIFYFVFFSSSLNVGNQSHPLPLPSGPIPNCHIPCFHFMLCVTTVIINTEYINNIYMYCILPEITHFLSIG